jgi:molybdopterin molybdotransferase
MSMASDVNHNVEWDLAVSLSNQSVVAKPAIQRPLADALNQVLAEELVSQISLPPAHTAMMDGYAVFGAGPWNVVGELHAGSYLPYLEAGCALKVSTGAHLPPHCSFVIPQELATLFDGSVAGKNSFTPGQHIRTPGDEAQAGDVIATKGALLNPAVMGLATSSQIDEVLIYEQPSLSIIVTGSELVSSGTPELGQIRDSLTIQVSAWVEYLGAKVSSSINCPDELSTLANLLGESAGDIVIVTGGSSHGERDFLRTALSELGATYIVDEILMRPGHPSLLAKLPNGQLVAGLPGNPLAALVSFMTIVAPALRGLVGQPESELAKIQLVFDHPCDRTRVVPIVMSCGKAELTEFRGSAMLRGLSHAQGLGVISPGENPAGTLIRVLPLPWRVN